MCFLSVPQYHTSEQAADLVFEPAMKVKQKLEKPNFERNFLAKKTKNRKREEITVTNLNFLMLGFPKKMLEKLLISAFSSPLKFLDLREHYLRPHFNCPKQPESHYAAVLNVFMYSVCVMCCLMHFEYHSVAFFFFFFFLVSNIYV